VRLGSGWVTASLRVQPFIATLSMMVLARGLAKYASGGMKVSTAVQNPDGTYRYVDVPPLFRAIDHRVLGGNLSVVTVIFLVCVAAGLAGFVEASLGPLPLCHRRQRRGGAAFGRAGGGRENLRLRRVRPIRGGGRPVPGGAGTARRSEAGSGYELTAIAMVVIGGTSLMGGRGGIGLTLLGVLTIGYLDKILSINAVPEAGRLVLTGIIIVAAG
jgi:ribose transport system permease protein